MNTTLRINVIERSKAGSEITAQAIDIDQLQIRNNENGYETIDKHLRPVLLQNGDYLINANHVYEIELTQTTMPYLSRQECSPITEFNKEFCDTHVDTIPQTFKNPCVLNFNDQIDPLGFLFEHSTSFQNYKLLETSHTRNGIVNNE